MKPVTSEIVITDFDWRSGTFILEILGTHGGRHCFRSAPWCRDDVSIIAAWTEAALGYTIFNGAIAHLLLFSFAQSTVEEVGSWNLEQYWANLTMVMGRVSSQPGFACVLAPGNNQIIVTGPPLEDSEVPATRLLDIRRKAFIKVGSEVCLAKHTVYAITCSFFHTLASSILKRLEIVSFYVRVP